MFELSEVVDTVSGEKENLKDFIENAPMPMHWVNGSGVVIWVNAAELSMLGYSKEEFVNKHISTFHADPAVIEDILRRLMNKETLKDYPARLKCKNGDIKDVLINSNVYFSNNEFIHTRCFTKDITDIKRVQEQMAARIRKLEEELQVIRKSVLL
jgi:two-component system, OmpR family, sensor histidine kinase VicK